MDIVQELRNKTSRDNRALLDRAAEEIERLRREVDAFKSSDAPNKIAVPAILGNLVAEVGEDPDYPEIFIYLERKDGVQIDLVMAGPIDYSSTNIRAGLYTNTASDDYTKSFTWSEDALMIEK